MAILQHHITIQLLILAYLLLQQIQVQLIFIHAIVLLFMTQIKVHICLCFLQLIHQQVPVRMDLTVQLDQFVHPKVNVHLEIAVHMLCTITMVMVQTAHLNMLANLKK
jgi:hypothetical protein